MVGKKINGKMSKREVVRRMWNREVSRGQTHAFSYVARRLGFGHDYKTMIHFLTWMAKHEGCTFNIVGKNVQFVF